MEGLFAWIRNIVCYICFFNVFMHVLPGKGFQKYVRYFGSLILVVIVLNPLGDLTNLTENFERSWKIESQREAYDDLEITMQGIDELRSEKVNAAYKTELIRQMEAVVRSYGLYPVRTEVEFQKDDNEALSVARVEMVVSKERSGIHVSLESAPEAEGQEAERVKNIKNEIEEVYHINRNHMNISIED